MTSLFKGIPPKEKYKLFTLLRSHIYTFDANKDILPTIKNENIIGIIDEGCANIIRIDYNGDKTLIEELEKDSIFGTSISALYNNELEIITKEKTTVIIIDYKNLLNEDNTNKKYYNLFIQNLFSILNDKIKEKNNRISILTNKTIRNRLLEYFNVNITKGSRYVYLPFSFTNLADYLGVDRSAMSRELKYMKEEGFIEIKGKRITILY